MALSYLCLIVSLILALFNVYWWPATFAYRPSLWGASWFFFVLYIVLTHGGVNVNR